MSSQTVSVYHKTDESPEPIVRGLYERADSTSLHEEPIGRSLHERDKWTSRTTTIVSQPPPEDLLETTHSDEPPEGG